MIGENFQEKKSEIAPEPKLTNEALPLAKRRVSERECSFCHKVKRVATRRLDGKAVCHACYHRLLLKAECSLCHKIRTIAIRTENEIICSVCYRKVRKERCSICYLLKGVTLRTTEKEAICDTCYQKNINREKCFICRRIGSVATRTNEEGEGRAICRQCYQKNILLEECATCGRIRGIAIRKEGKAVCRACYQKNILKGECGICRQIKPISSRTGGKVVCSTCYQRQKRVKKLLQWFLNSSLDEAAYFVVEAARRKNKNRLKRLALLLSIEEGQQRLRQALKTISHAVVAKKIVAEFLETEQGKILKDLAKQKAPTP